MIQLAVDSVSELPSSVEAEQRRTEELQTAKRDLTSLMEAMGIQFELSVENATALLRSLDAVRQASPSVLNARNQELVNPASIPMLRAGRDIQKRAAKLRDELAFELRQLPRDAGTLRQESVSLRSHTRLGALLPSVRRARATWSALFEANKRPPQSQMAHDLEVVAELVDLRERVSGNRELRRYSGESFDGIDTDFDSLISAAELVQCSRTLMSRDLRASAAISDFVTLADSSQLLRAAQFAFDTAKLDPSVLELSNAAALIDDLIRAATKRSAVSESTLSLVDQLGVKPDASRSQIEEAADAATRLRSTGEALSRFNHTLEPDSVGIPKDLLNTLATVEGSIKFLNVVLRLESEGYSRLGKAVFTPTATQDIEDAVVSLVELDVQVATSEPLVQALLELSHADRTEFWLFNLNLSGCLDRLSAEAGAVPSLTRRLNLNSTRSDVLRPDTVVTLRAFEIENGRFDLPDAWELSYWRSAIESTYTSVPRLRSYSGLSIEQGRRRLKSLDERVRALSAAQVRGLLSRRTARPGISSGPAARWTERALIVRLASQVRPRVTLRDFLARAFSAAVSLKPCFMMSPASVAQNLKQGGHLFDLVIIDEASQMRTEGAVGAIARGRQVVIVGDQMQLPPSSFFARLGIDDDDSEDDIFNLDEESILERAVAAFHPSRELLWHYRSRHESLIAFSNHEFYDDRLIVFPSPRTGPDSDLGVRFHHVSDGAYLGGGGGSRTNPVEAETVARFALRIMETTPDRSLGIAATNKPQADLIDDEIFRLIADSPAAQEYLAKWDGTLEPFFVKNLENVQGDERDHVIVSTVYSTKGGNARGLNLGPIQYANGYRRLNVLFTRAKYRLDVFSSLVASEIRTDQATNRGREVLRNYLDYAATGRLGSGETDVRAAPDSDFELAVAAKLEQRGFEVDFQVGVAGFRIDIGVRHPDYPHGYVAGVECDGATYHSARAARDRDLLRQDILEGLGWRIIRVWSTDWFLDPSGQTDRLVEELTHCLERARSDALVTAPWMTGDQPDGPNPVLEEPKAGGEVPDVSKPRIDHSVASVAASETGPPAEIEFPPLTALGYSASLPRGERWTLLRERAIPQFGTEGVSNMLRSLIGQARAVDIDYSVTIAEWEHDLQIVSGI